jgi:chemotaxis protein MotB
MDATPIIIKKKKSHGHAHHGGSWKVAYADFVTAMMAFFMVMWIMGLSDDTKAQIQGYFNDPIGFVKSQPKSRTVISPKGLPSPKPGQNPLSPQKMDRQSMKNLQEELKKVEEDHPELKDLLEKVKIEMTEEGLRIEFLEDKNDFFESGQADLKPGAKKVIDVIGRKLAQSGRQMTIEGHTDSEPFAGDPMGNFKLSSARASALSSELGRMGVSPVKVKRVAGLADTALRDPAHPMSAVNRRVTIMLPFSAAATAKELLPQDAVKSAMAHPSKINFNISPQPPDISPHKK